MTGWLSALNTTEKIRPELITRTLQTSLQNIFFPYSFEIIDWITHNGMLSMVATLQSNEIGNGMNVLSFLLKQTITFNLFSSDSWKITIFFVERKKNTELQTNQRRLEGKWKNVKWIHVWLSLKSFLMLSKRDQLPNVLGAGCLECRHCLYTGAGRGINLTISMELEVFYHTGI